MNQLLTRAADVQRELQVRDLKLVLAESCTCGRIAATLGALPGISSYLCGSQVVYRNLSKQQWLGVDAQILDDPEHGPVS